MFFFIWNCLFWVLALYILFLIGYHFAQKRLLQRQKLEDTYLIIATKNSERTIENLLTSIFYTEIFSKQNIILVDRDSTDDTKKILEKMNYHHEQVKIMTWNELDHLLGNSPKI